MKWRSGLSFDVGDPYNDRHYESVESACVRLFILYAIKKYYTSRSVTRLVKGFPMENPAIFSFRYKKMCICMHVYVRGYIGHCACDFDFNSASRACMQT